MPSAGDSRSRAYPATGQPSPVPSHSSGRRHTTAAEIAATTRACSYDRAGYGWSEPGPLPRSAGREAAELHKLLATAGERGPYVLVAHSLGANVSRLFLGRFPKEVAGLVLVDPTDPETVIVAGTPSVPIAQYRLSSILGRLGGVRLFGESLVTLSVGTDPPGAVIENAAVVYGPQSLATAVDELRASVDDARDVVAVTAPGAWGSLPVVVVTAGSGGDPAFGRELAALSEAGRHLVAQASGHYVQYDQPQIVVDVLLEVVASARQPR